MIAYASARRPLMTVFDPKTLVDKITALPADRIAEIEDFVDFIGQREERRLLVRASGAVSAPSLTRVWSNPEDDVYDAL